MKKAGAKPSASKKPGASRPTATRSSELQRSAQPAGSRLGVAIDGRALPDDEARALWEAFSAHMDANRGDFAGFAASRGYRSARPEYQRGRAMLLLET